MHLLVVERADVLVPYKEGELGIEQFVADACRLGVLVDALLGRPIEHLATGRQTKYVVFVAGSLTNFEATLVCRIVDAKHINQFGLERGFKLHTLSLL